MATVTISGMTLATASKVQGTAVMEIEDSDGVSVKTTLATLRTLVFAGGTGYTASDPLNIGKATLTGGTVTVSTPTLQATQTWNAGAVTFTGRDLNVTDTASAVASLLDNLRVGGVSKWSVDKSGNVTATGNAVFGSGAASPSVTVSGSSSGSLFVQNTGSGARQWRIMSHSAVSSGSFVISDVTAGGLNRLLIDSTGLTSIPSGGLIVGTDPGSSALLRVGGTLRIAGIGIGLAPNALIPFQAAGNDGAPSGSLTPAAGHAYFGAGVAVFVGAQSDGAPNRGWIQVRHVGVVNTYYDLYLQTLGGGVFIGGPFGCNGNTAQGKAVSGGTLAGVIAALVANGILSS